MGWLDPGWFCMLPVRVDLDLAGPPPAVDAAALSSIRSDMEKDRLEQAEAAAVAMLENNPRRPHIFLILSELALRRNDAVASAEFLRNASLIASDCTELHRRAVAGLVDVGQIEAARELIDARRDEADLEAVLADVRRIVFRDDAMASLHRLLGVEDPSAVSASSDEPIVLGEMERSFETFEDAPVSDMAALEGSSLENTAIDVGTLPDADSSILPGSSPFAITPIYHLARRTACPGLAAYLSAYPPSWTIPRTEDLLSKAASGIQKAVDFYEAMHFRGMWPLSFTVEELSHPSEGHESRPRDFRWELGQPGFAKLLIAHVISGFEATRYTPALKHVVRSAKALAVHQHRLGGWATTYRVRKATGRGWPASFPANAVWLGDDSTCTTLCLLIYAAQQVEVQMVTTAAQRALQAIMQAQNPDGGWPMVWVEQERARAELDRQYGFACLLGGVMDNAMRALALGRYALHRHEVSVAMGNATRFLLERQAQGQAPGWLCSYDSSGSPGPHGAGVSIEATLSAIDALCFGAVVSDKTRCADAARNALKWIEQFEQAEADLPDLYDPRTGKPLESESRRIPAYRVRQAIDYLQRRVHEDLLGNPSVQEKILRGRILHDAEELGPLVATLLQHQHPCGMWADATGKAVPAGGYVWTLAQFMLQYQAGVGAQPVDAGRRTHWQDMLMPDRQWLKVE